MWSINGKEENEIKFEITKKWCIKWEIILMLFKDVLCGN